MPMNHVDRPIILGIVGDSAAGKTTLASGVAEILGKDQVVIICTDDYHKYDRTQRAENGTSALDLKCNYLDIIENDLNSLRNGKAIIKPIYSHNDGTLNLPCMLSRNHILWWRDCLVTVPEQCVIIMMLKYI